MLSKDIYKYIENPREKAKADLVNTILDKFNESQTPRIIEYVQFHTEMTNNPIGTRVIYMEDKGYTLVHGDGDKGLGVEYLYNEFTKEWISKYYYNIKDDISEDLYKVGYIDDIEDFVNYSLKILKCNYTFDDVLKNKDVKEYLNKVLLESEEDSKKDAITQEVLVDVKRFLKK